MNRSFHSALAICPLTLLLFSAAGATAQTRVPPGGVVNACPSTSQSNPAVALSVDPTQVGYSVWGNGTVGFSLPLGNDGTQPAYSVTISSITVQSGIYGGPTPLPLHVGAIDDDDVQPVYANMALASVPSSGTIPLSLAGTFAFQNRLCPFQVNIQVPVQPPSNGGTPKSYTIAPTHNVYGVTFNPPLPHPADEPNDEPSFFPPLGLPRYLFTTPPAQSVLDLNKALHPTAQPPSSGNANDVVFVRNQQSGTYNALPPDPNAAGATTSGFVLTSANGPSPAASVSYSKDFGSTFTTVDLTKAAGFTDPAIPSRTDFFPESDGGLCCDQVVHYIPARNLLVWLLQYWSPSLSVGGLPEKGQNRLRIAYATPQAAAADFLHAWTWFDVSPSTLGDNTSTDWMDYPDLAFSNDYLYISVDHGFWNAGKNSAGNVIGQQVYSGKRWFVRASLNDMAGNASSVGLIYYEASKSGVYKAHFAQNATDTMYYAAEPDTSTLSVFKDPDISPNVPTPKDIGITSYCASSSSGCDYSATASDGQNWNQAPHAVLGGTLVSLSPFCFGGPCTYPTNLLYFAFDGGRDASHSRPNPYVRVEKIDADKLARISELDIWNAGFSFATAALIANPAVQQDEVAFSLATDGGTGYGDNAVGFLGDFVAYLTTSSNTTQSNGTTVRYGDYFAARNSISPGDQYGQGYGFSTLGYSVTEATAGKTCAVAGCNVTLRYILFGREAELFPPPPVIIR